jgi:CHASE2 domain-containing sensor protein
MLFRLIALLLLVNVSCRSQKLPENNIVLINVGNLNRSGIAKEIAIINGLNPKVVSIDLQFAESKGDQDVMLVQSLWNCKNLVMSSMIQNYGGEMTFISLGSRIEFSPSHAKTGFINALPEDDELQTLKQFIVYQQENIHGDIEYHFSIRTAMSFDSLKAMRFVGDHPKIMDIDYKKGARIFKAFSANDVLGGKISRKDVEGNIVLIGILGPGDEDKFFTPINKKSHPYKVEMYGLEILANIVAQVLEYK